MEKKKNNIVIITLLAIAVVAVISIKNAKTKKPDARDDAACIPAIPAELPATTEASDSAQQSLPRLLDLGAGKCIPCKKMLPILSELKKTYTGKLDVELIDINENRNAKTKYGIRLIPTQIFFDANGSELFRHEGFISKEDILKKWEELGAELSAE